MDFKIGDTVKYHGEVYRVVDIDTHNNEYLIYNDDNETELWVDCSEVY